MLSLPAVLVFCCCCSKLSQMRWLKGSQMYYLAFLEVRSLKCPCWTIVRVSTVLCSSRRPSVGSASLLASASSGCMTQGPSSSEHVELALSPRAAISLAVCLLLHFSSHMDLVIPLGLLITSRIISYLEIS